ncbi:hypothetical protein J6590_101427 [Homalodisca vitripennis]|nr:hypothetical protein J6590_101427 [Homalodisca vitripennis]
MALWDLAESCKYFFIGLMVKKKLEKYLSLLSPVDYCARKEEHTAHTVGWHHL